MMTLQQFRVLLAVREHGSLTQAAEALRYGVPTITHHLNTLESYLQVKLVVRSPRGAHLTPLGEILAEEVERILTRVRQTEQLVADHRDAGLATLRVGSFASMGSRLLPRAISQLQAKFPVRVEIVEAEPTEVVRMLRSGEVHAGIIYDFADDPAFISEDLRVVPLLTEPFRVMISARSVRAEHDRVNFAELTDATWICSRNENETTDRALRKVCRAQGYEPRELMRTDDLNMILGLVAENLGYALATPMSVDGKFDVLLKPAVQHIGERRTSLVLGTGYTPSIVEELSSILFEVVRDYQDDASTVLHESR